MIVFAFDSLNLNRIEADVDPRNERSMRLLERLGFQREGYLRQRYCMNGERQESHAWTTQIGLECSEVRLTTFAKATVVKSPDPNVQATGPNVEFVRPNK